MAFIAARILVLRGRPPGRAGGINGFSRAHSTSPDRSDSRRPPADISDGVSFVHIAVRHHRRPCSRESRDPAPSNPQGKQTFTLDADDHGTGPRVAGRRPPTHRHLGCSVVRNLSPSKQAELVPTRVRARTRGRRGSVAPRSPPEPAGLQNLSPSKQCVSHRLIF